MRGGRAVWVCRLLVVFGIVGGLVVGVTAKASAHAELEHTSPAAGSVLQRAPAEVTLTFGEGVGVNSGDVEVFDDQLHRVDLGDAGHLTGRLATVGVRLPAHLRRGTYTVTWRVISADSHPVSGGFTFSIGAATLVNGTVEGLGGGSRTVGILLGAMRFLGYLGLVAGPGGLVFLMIWPGGRRDRWTRRIIGGGLVTGVVSACGMFLVQAPYAQGASLAHLFDGTLLDAVAHDRYGRVIVVRLALWLVLAVSVGLAAVGLRAALGFVAASGLALPVTWALAGHGDTGRQIPLSIASGTVHVIAVTIWLSGLLILTIRLLPVPDRGDLMVVLHRFSAVAFGCVGAILLTGFYQAWREIGLSWAALVTTTYGRLVVAKILTIGVLVILGAYGRWSLGAATPPRSEPAAGGAIRDSIVRSHLRRSVFMELGLGIGVLVVTSILVNSIPAKEAVVYTAYRELSAPGLRVDVVIAPARVGTDTMTVSVSRPKGRPRPASVSAGSLSLPEADIDSLPLTFTPIATSGTATAVTSLPRAGSWRLSFDVQTSPIDVTEFSTTFVVH